ncbi:cyclic nucleotide-binding domain-containing protein [Micromonospora sp. WMMD730]|uniref:cyclic nucleotide-binding domain-containing protein n=1 Tax=Micromonospora sp. WMMD730 TaxID=3404128 RepID=UPI003B95BA40
MAERTTPDGSAVPIVSCDIVGHSTTVDIQVQESRIAAINDIVAAAMQTVGAGEVVWASGGDGGHVIFCGADWQQAALDLVTALRRWSISERVPLRVTAHAGLVRFLDGADGRRQPVGAGINTAGWLLSRGPAAGVLVSRAFRRAIEGADIAIRVVFDCERRLRDKSGKEQDLELMSVGEDRSAWDDPTEEDRRRLEFARTAGLGWETVYRAKRILQIDSSDEEAEAAIRDLERRHLGYLREEVRGDSNPFFEHLTQPSFRDVILAGQLVERGYNEYICRTGDGGETMFVILRGQVGVYLPGREGEGVSSAPDFIHGEGEIVGELAFAMSRRRTADLVALTDTTLLTFDIKELKARLPADVWTNVRAFMRARALEHVGPRVQFLGGGTNSAPSARGERSWKLIRAKIVQHCDLIQIERTRSTHFTYDLVQEARRKDDVPGRGVEDDPTAGHGAYLLVGGQLREAMRSETSGVDRRPLPESEGYPLLWVNLPGTVILPKREFHIEEEPVTVLHLRESGLIGLDAPQRDAFYQDLRLAAASCFEYDAFISYNQGDADAADRWQRAMKDAGLRVFRDVPRTGEEFPGRIAAAIRQSRALVALVSPHVMVKSDADNWVIREINAHQHFFDHRCVFPVILPGGDHKNIVHGYAPIKADRGEAIAMKRLIDELKDLRDGLREPPYSLTEKTGAPRAFLSAPTD